MGINVKIVEWNIMVIMIDEVMANQSDLVKPVYELKQILCIKGD